jgi:aryl-alcohol dehydrogenase-like predicted oxidoreductase
MEEHQLGRTGRQVSVLGLGTWQLGADWGDVSEADARAVLEASAEEGVTFYDTADVYGDGRSEQIVGSLVAAHPGARSTEPPRWVAGSTRSLRLNALRLKPPEQVLPAAEAAGVGIIARVPLASGLLSGQYDEITTSSDDDHRNYNRDGSAFDIGETLSGVPYDVASRQRAASPGW